MVFRTRVLWNSVNTVKNGVKETVGKKPPFLIVTSLGNPENVYGGTRHNTGHLLLSMTKLPFVDHPKLGAIKYALDLNKSNILYLQPKVFMNVNGSAIAPAWKFFTSIKEDRYEVKHLVVHDDLSLPLGKLKIRKNSTSFRGHNGLKSIREHTRTEFQRISIGIGRPESREPHVVAEYVLSPFNRKEKTLLQEEVLPEMMQIIEQVRKGEL